MTLSPGTRLGPYEITASIGAGGMGEVYKAKDTRLDRSVAIKVLPAHVSADPERRARFAREAKTIAGLNHPHICTLYDVGEHDPSTDSTGSRRRPRQAALYLVMEHLTGETLAQRLEKGPLPLDQALTVATEIADALAAAHRQGVDPPGPQARERDAHERRRQAPRLRAREAQGARRAAGGRQPRVGADADRATDERGDDRRDAALHGPGAGRGKARGCADGPMGTGSDPLRDADRQAGL